ncbi:MAG: GntR family transcriptional regulator [Roseburia sp.]|nr:GntR family transcriptional regulator [Roseburia sp.]
MKLIINPNGEQPIYEQIKLQIKEQIVSGELKDGEILPSIRMLAKELKIGIITAKRAYDDLTEEGYTVSVAGKGVFVAAADRDKLTAAALNEIEKHVSTCVRFAKANGVERQSFEKIVQKVWEDDE